MAAVGITFEDSSDHRLCLEKKIIFGGLQKFESGEQPQKVFALKTITNSVFNSKNSYLKKVHFLYFVPKETKETTFLGLIGLQSVRKCNNVQRGLVR